MAPVPRNKRAKHRKKSGPPLAAIRAAAAAASQPSPPAASASASASASTSGKRAAANGPTHAEHEPDTELVFEDPYGDEFEDEETDVQLSPSKPVGEIVDPMVVNDAVVFRPGKDKIADDERLVCDESAYELFHKCTVEWPALSFDIVCMNAAGEYNNMAPIKQDVYPMSVSMILGTQANQPNKNKLVCLRMSNMHRSSGARKGSKPRVVKEVDSDDDSSDDDSSDDDTNLMGPDRNAILQSADIRLDSTVNRVRVMPQHANIVAAWTESGRVNLVDAAPALNTLYLDSRKRMNAPNSPHASSIKPFYTFAGHRLEGYGLDWSRVVEGRLLSGALNGGIYLTEACNNGASWATCADRYRGHIRSVEDIQWSPNERDVFASCSADHSIRIWDAREYRKPVLGVAEAHNSDVNVISWNRNETHLLVSGGDDGIIKVWDLRSVNKSGNESAKSSAEFKQHQKAISCVQWHPTDASMLCAGSEDGSVSIWDLAVERDAEEEVREGVVLSGSDEFPAQLLFIHMGQKNIKDAQWHPACPSLLISTAEDGLNMFQASNITLPS